jgi:hypothetical protein
MAFKLDSMPPYAGRRRVATPMGGNLFESRRSLYPKVLINILEIIILFSIIISEGSFFGIPGFGTSAIN